MKCKGYISHIGEPRSWTNQQGEKMFSYPLELRIPYLNSQGEERYGELMGEHIASNPDYIQKLEAEMKKNSKMEFTCSFSIKDWKDKRIGNMRVTNIQMLME